MRDYVELKIDGLTVRMEAGEGERLCEYEMGCALNAASGSLSGGRSGFITDLLVHLVEIEEWDEVEYPGVAARAWEIVRERAKREHQRSLKEAS